MTIEALAIIEEGIENRACCFRRDPDGDIKYEVHDNDGFAFSVKVEFI